ncbi:hypothetical protein U9M48_012210, partial [Paspalum notatum var. saurae]
ELNKWLGPYYQSSKARAMATSSSSTLEILQAQAELYNLGLAYLKSIALQCAIKLRIPNAIYSCGGSASLSDLLAIVPVPEHRKPYLPRLMRFLTATGIIALDSPSADDDNTATVGGRVMVDMYRLTPVSCLLVDDVGAKGQGYCTNLSPFVLSLTTKYHLTASMHLAEWFEGLDGETRAPMPFKMAYGTDLWEYLRHDPHVSEAFNDGMASDSQVVLDFVVIRCREVFDGITSLVDVGGGTGSAARTIAKAFPHVKCSVLDLSSVISSIEKVDDGTIEYIAGDMLDYIPPTDAVLLKNVLHDWNDEECVKILTQCKKAISSRNSTSGKVIIIDIIIGSTSKLMSEVQVSYDLCMMMMTMGKEREEHEWRKIFMDAGFGHYKTRPVMGFLSIIELYPAQS